MTGDNLLYVSSPAVTATNGCLTGKQWQKMLKVKVCQEYNLVVQILLALSYLLFLPWRSPLHWYTKGRWHRSHIIPQNILCDEPVSKYLFFLQMVRKWLKIGNIFTWQCTSVVLTRLLLKVASLFLPESRQPFQEALPKPRGRCSMWCALTWALLLAKHYSRIGVVKWREKSCVTWKTLILGLLLVQLCLEIATEARDCGVFWMENEHLRGEGGVAC